jgi:hypothetical protein
MAYLVQQALVRREDKSARQQLQLHMLATPTTIDR